MQELSALNHSVLRARGNIRLIGPPVALRQHRTADMLLTTPNRTPFPSVLLKTESSTLFKAPQTLSTFSRVHRQLHANNPSACVPLSCQRVNHIKHWRISGQSGSRRGLSCQASSAEQSNTMPQPNVLDQHLTSDASAMRDSSMPRCGILLVLIILLRQHVHCVTYGPVVAMTSTSQRVTCWYVNK